MIVKHLITIKNKGFTLIEIIMTILILGLSSLILIPFFGAIVHSPDPLIREKAISLGQALMDEILSKRWDHNTPNGGGPIKTTESNDTGATDCTAGCTGGVRIDCYRCTHSGYPNYLATDPLGREGGENPTADDRTLWNDIDDYIGLDEPIAGNFYDQDGQQLPGGFNGYRRKAFIKYINSNLANIDHNTVASVSATTDTKLIFVEVTSPRGEIFNFVAVACNI